jgi:hypothetical protein
MEGVFAGARGWSLAWRTEDKSVADNVSLDLIFTRLPTLKSTSFPTLFPTAFPTRLPALITTEEIGHLLL